MRLDPKYFNLFLVICAVVTAFAIVFGTFSYISNQRDIFKSEIKNTDLSDWNFKQYSAPDSLSIDQFKGTPIVILFWSTWSDKSKEINQKIQNDYNDRPVIIAAAVRDGDQQVLDYMEANNYSFKYIDGTSFYHDLKVPGVPSQLFINSDGEIVDQHVGQDMEQLDQKIRQLTSNQ